MWLYLLTEIIMITCYNHSIITLSTSPPLPPRWTIDEYYWILKHEMCDILRLRLKEDSYSWYILLILQIEIITSTR